MAKGRKPGRGPRDVMAQVAKMQEALSQAQSQLGDLSVEASAGGGAVKVVMSGAMECKGVEISPELLQAGDQEMIQDLLMLAVNQALTQAQELAAERLGPIAGMGPGGLRG